MSSPDSTKDEAQRLFEAARAYFKSNLQGKTIQRAGFPPIRCSGKSWVKFKDGVKLDLLKAKLLPCVVEVILTGKYDGRTELYKARHDSAIAFHFFEKVVTVGEVTACVGVTVMEDAAGHLFYNATHDGDKAWQKRKGASSTGLRARLPETPVDSDDEAPLLDGIVQQDGGSVNLHIIWVVGASLDSADDWIRTEDAARQSAYGPNKHRQPTKAMQDAGNYKMGRTSIRGIAITIEQPRGSVRTGTKPNGQQWQSRLAAHYGYLTGTTGADGDGIDCFLGPWPEAQYVYCINQVVPGKGVFDEVKLMLGFMDEDHAKRTYTHSYDRGWAGFGSIVRMTYRQLRWWIRNGNMKRALELGHLPAADGVYDSVKDYAALQECFFDRACGDHEGFDQDVKPSAFVVQGNSCFNIPFVASMPSIFSSDSASSECVTNTSARHPEILSNHRKSGPLLSQPQGFIKIPQLRANHLVQPNVLRLSHHLQVLDGVVEAVFIPVMNDFAAQQLPAEMSFNNKPVLKTLTTDSVDFYADQPIESVVLREVANVPSSGWSSHVIAPKVMRDSSYYERGKKMELKIATLDKANDDTDCAGCKRGYWAMPGKGSSKSPVFLAVSRSQAQTAWAKFCQRLSDAELDKAWAQWSEGVDDDGSPAWDGKDITETLMADAYDTVSKPTAVRVAWDGVEPKGYERAGLSRVLYALRQEDGEDGLLLDAITVQDIEDSADELIGAAETYDALVVEARRIERTGTALMRVLKRQGGDLAPTAVAVSKPMMRAGAVNQTITITLADGQTLTVWFHNPDATPRKLKPDDELVSWKWMLNRKDVTIAVAPERGVDLDINVVARRIMALASKNSAAFVQANKGKVDQVALRDSLREEVKAKTAELEGLIVSIESAKAAKAADPASDPAAVAEKLFVTFGGKIYPVDSVEDAAAKWNVFREESSGGASEIGNGVQVTNAAGKVIAEISYNGRIWPAGSMASMEAEAERAQAEADAAAFAAMPPPPPEWTTLPDNEITGWGFKRVGNNTYAKRIEGDGKSANLTIREFGDPAQWKVAISISVPGLTGASRDVGDYTSIDELRAAISHEITAFQPPLEAADPALEFAETLSGFEFGDFADTPEGLIALRAAAVSELESMRGDWVDCPALKAMVEIRPSSAAKIESMSSDSRKLKAVAAIKKIIGSASLVSKKPPYNPARERNIVAYYTMRSTIRLAGEALAVRIVLKEDDKGKFHWDHTIHSAAAVFDGVQEKGPHDGGPDPVATSDGRGVADDSVEPTRMASNQPSENAATFDSVGQEELNLFIEGEAKQESPAVGAETHEPWEMTREEVDAIPLAQRPSSEDWSAYARDVVSMPSGNPHRRAVEAALREGKDVPASIRTLYPDMAEMDAPRPTPAAETEDEKWLRGVVEGAVDITDTKLAIARLKAFDVYRNNPAQESEWLSLKDKAALLIGAKVDQQIAPTDTEDEKFLRAVVDGTADTKDGKAIVARLKAISISAPQLAALAKDAARAYSAGVVARAKAALAA